MADYEQAYTSHAIPTPHVSYLNDAGWMQSQSAGGLAKTRKRSHTATVGSRRQVWNGTASKTVGNLTKADLMMNKWGRIVSRVKHATAKKEKRLQKHGYFTQKGKFGYCRRISHTKKH